MCGSLSTVQLKIAWISTMPVTRIYLPYASTPLHFCLICGYSNQILHKACSESSEFTLEKPGFKLLDEVEYFKPSHDYDSRSDLIKKVATINRLWYSQPGEVLRCFYRSREIRLKPHTLCVKLATSLENINERPWKPGDSSMGWVSMTYSDFLLWKEGGIQKLQEAGLLGKPKGKYLTLRSRIKAMFERLNK